MPSTKHGRDLAARYFGADFALGTNLMTWAATNRWTFAQALLDGVRRADPRDVALTLLASTTLSSDDGERVSTLVQRALDEPAARKAVGGKVARLCSFRSSDVHHVLADPERAHKELVDLLAWAVETFGPAEDDVVARLDTQASTIDKMLATRGRSAALLTLTGGWTLTDDAQPLVLFPTQVASPFVITRLLPDGCLLLVFGAHREPDDDWTLEELAAIGHALGSEQRLAILRQIGKEAATGQMLAETFHITQATVHYHTSMLRSVGLVTSLRDSHSVFHSVDGKRLRRALAQIQGLVADEGPDLI